jgi:hypothetical protein
MKALLVLVLLASVAQADDTAVVDKLVRSFFKGLDDPAAVANLCRKDAVLARDDTFTATAANDATAFMMTVTVKTVDSLVVKIDPNIKTHAFFKGIVVGETFDQTGDSCRDNKPCIPPARIDMHVSGLAIFDGSWKLAAIFVTDTRSDADLVRVRKPSGDWDVMDKKLEQTGDKALLAAASTWIAGGFAQGAANGWLHAGGTELAEVADDAKAKTLAAKWDKLKMWPQQIDAMAFSDYGIVIATLGWPVKRNDIRMRMAAIATLDHGVWKWIVLDFG